MIFNTAVYRSFADNETVQNIPAEFEIDYVKVYTKTKCPDAIPKACNEGINNPIVFIDEDTDWDQCDTKDVADQYKYITVTNNSELMIRDSEIKMLLPGKITVESGSSLLLVNTTIKPCEEGTRWQGIFLENGANIKLKEGSVIQTSRLGIYNDPDLNNQISSEGEMSGDHLENGMSTTAGNNEVILNNSSLIDNFNGLTIDGDNNVISLRPANTIKGSHLATVIRGNVDGYFEFRNVKFEDNDVSLFAKDCGDKHVIEDCNFNNNNVAIAQITVKNVDGLDFQMNTLDGPGYLLDAFDSHIDIVNDNEFLNSRNAIWVSSTYPTGAGARIGDLNGAVNQFSGNEEGIIANGLNSSIGGIIQNNKFENTNNTAINVDGISLSIITNNTIDGAEDGIYISKTGGANNAINCNLFENNTNQDLTIELDNNNTLFLQNDFTNSQNNGNIILSEARVENMQGDVNNPSDNCFNVNALEDLHTDAATSFFQYYHNNAISCRIPNGNGNYQALSTQANGDHCPEDLIGSNFTSTPPGPIRLMHHFGTYTSNFIDPNINDALTHLVLIGGDDPYTYIDESLPNTELLPNVNYSPTYLANIQAINDYESDLDYWIRAAIQYAIDNDDYVYGENVLLLFKKWRWQEMLFGLYVKSAQWSKARTLLNSLPQNTTYEGEFIDLQHINLDRMLNGEPTITPNQIQTVYAIATGDTPAAGYAIPIYYHLTGIRLSNTVPSSHGTRSIAKNMDDLDLYLSPNPAMDILSLQNQNDRKLSDIQIINHFYQVKINLTADNLDHINISNLVPGWYILKCVVEDEKIVTLPFVKL